jgi:hypothetical protein
MTQQSKARPKAARNGNASRHDAIGQAVTALNTWADADSTALYDEQLHEGLGALMLWMIDRAPTAIDPFTISLA